MASSVFSSQRIEVPQSVKTLGEGAFYYCDGLREATLPDGLTEITEGTEVTITAEIGGFLEDEIVDITWQYRTENDAEDAFRNIDGVNGLVYTYSVTDENVHNEWRIVLTLNS